MSSNILAIGAFLLVGGSFFLLLSSFQPSPNSTGTRVALIQLLPGRNALIVLIAFLAAGVTWMVSTSPLIPFIVLIGGIIIPRKFYAMMYKKHADLIDSQVPDMLAMTAGAMRAGAALMTALESVAQDGPMPIKAEVEMMLREVHLGSDLDEALDHWAERVKSTEMIMVATAIKIARESGGNLSESLERLANATRDRQNMEKKVLALTAQGRMQAYVMAVLPFGFLYALFKLDPYSMAPMFHTIGGWAVFLAVCVWIFIGFRVIKKIMSIDI